MFDFAKNGTVPEPVMRKILSRKFAQEVMNQLSKTFTISCLIAHYIIFHDNDNNIDNYNDNSPYNCNDRRTQSRRCWVNTGCDTQSLIPRPQRSNNISTTGVEKKTNIVAPEKNTEKTQTTKERMNPYCRKFVAMLEE